MEGFEWQDERFKEISISGPAHWQLYIPRRRGCTTLMRRLATYFVGRGRDVRVLSAGDGHSFDNIPHVKRFESDSDAAIITSNTVLLIDGLIKWDPTRYIRDVDGLVVIAHSYDFDTPPRAYEIVRRLTL